MSFADNMIFGSTVRDFDSFLRRLDKIDSENPQLRWFTDATRERAIKMKSEMEEISGMRF